MSWNIFLALIPVAMAQVLKYQKNIIIQLAILSVWLLFLPNTLYLITDGMYVFSEEFGNMHMFGMVLGVLLYAVIVAHAPYTYYWSVAPVIRKYKKQILNLNSFYKLTLVVFFSFIVALGITMGRFARTNPWHVFTQPLRTVNDIFISLFSKETTLFLSCFFIGIFVFNLLILRKITVAKQE